MSDLTITISKDKKILNNHSKYSKQLVTRKWQIYNSLKKNNFLINWTSRDENSFYFQKEGGVFTIGDPLFNGFLLNKKDLSNLYNNFLNNNNSFLKKLDGMYIIIFIKKNKLQIANSLFGSRNLFYYKNNKNIFISTNQFILKRISEAQIDLNGVAERACFHTNYGFTFLKKVKRLKHDKILIYEKNILNIKDQNRLKKIFIQKNKYKDINKSSSKLHNINYEILKKIFFNQKKILLSLSGGRDSRYVLANLDKNLKSKIVNTFSIGNDHEDEVKISKEVCKLNKIKNKIWTPKKIYSMRSFEKSLWDSGVFDITLTYKDQITSFIKKNYFNYLFVESTLIEVFLDDRSRYIDGNNNHNIINFIYNRKPTIEVKSFNKKLKFIKKTIKSAKILFDEFNYIRDPIKKIKLFEAAYFHSTWCLQAGMTHFFTTNRILSTAENIEFIKFIMNVDNNLLADSKFYDFHNYQRFNNFFKIITTRDLDKRVLNYFKQCCKNPKNLIFLRNLFIKDGALFSHLNNNKDIFLKYLHTNKKLLKKMFNDQFINWILAEQKKGIPTSRFYKIFCLLTGKKWIRLYDVLIPMSIIAVFKNFEKFPYKDVKPKKKNLFNF